MDALTIGMLLILVVLIFFMFRNGSKRRRQQEELQKKMVAGADVMTNFGLFGTLISVDEGSNQAELEIAPGTVVRVHRQALAKVVEATGSESGPRSVTEAMEIANREQAEREAAEAAEVVDPEYGERIDATKKKRQSKKTSE